MGHDLRRVALPKDCDMAFACAFHEDIARDLSTIGELQLDASAVERITTPAIQTLVMIARALGNENIHMSVEASSPAFAAGFGQLGLDAQLADWSAA